ncbi:MAG: 4Fe-4S dicluster domain-containing protein [Planctomycetota bacterium]|jgi:formate dehydrogenase iron-sulfur subunit
MSKKARAILFDMNECIGCRKCIEACMERQGFEGDPEKVTELSATAYTAMYEYEEYPVRTMCRHCLNPSCVSVCPCGALQKNKLGPVTWDGKKCMGCRYCMVACPFNIPRYEWDKPVPAVRKCDMCADLLEAGKPTACSEACPASATITGDRDELVAEAHKRIRENPDDYYDHVYGEAEVGGTSVLFLAPFPIESLGFKESLGADPLPDLTWQVLSKIPGIVVTGGASLLAIWWITKRRNEVALVEGRLQQRKGPWSTGPDGKENGNGKS